MTVPAPVPSPARAGHPDMAELRDSRRCAIAAATVVLVGAAPLAAHAARPSPGSREDAGSAATRRLIDAELGELGGTAAPVVAPVAATAPSDADGLPASPARALLVAQQTVPAATPPQPMPAPAPEMAPASPPEETLPPSPTVILPPEVPAAQPSAPTAQPQAPAAAVPSGPALQGPAPGALAPLPVVPA
ncbi:poly-beta-1,6 N-acetyl-D-glucosamine export porin PgaA, partial [Ralstonia solanacearum]|nr:poly-beta-1,6 N-acetyl-D-glucosamine export porin PgaA [Ralstonia solanacearum]